MDDVELTQTHWILVELNGRSVQASAGQADPHLRLVSDQELVGFGGCNRFFGGCRCEGNRLAISPLGSTRMFGDPEVMKQESEFLGALQSVATFEIIGSTLTLASGDRAVARFRAEFDEP